ncbi:MAG: hypothetical protein LIO81_07605 [Clostridiales bacterium]|nr:hypothetical protein [Clostridiales bacterium]
MSAVRGNTARKTKNRPYEFHLDKKSGGLYLRPERPPFWGELPYASALVVTVLFALLPCFQYIHVRTEVETHLRRTEALERQYILQQNENSLAEKVIFQIPSLDEVYEIATVELGMVPADSENVFVYERSNSEFIYQTDNIPSIGYH